MYLHRCLLITIVLISSFNGVGVAQFVPYFDLAFRWKTIETSHFSVIFHQGLEGMAQEAATYAEEFYDIIKKEFNRAPVGKINIVIYDETDFSNGSTNQISNTITLLAVAARRAESSNVRLDSWMKLVVFHELLHIMDLDMATGAQALLRKIFGRIIVPQRIKPVSLIEGLAVYEKWKHLGESRLNDSRTRMILRTLVAENRMPSYSEMTTQYTRDHWPNASVLNYNLAAWFLRYLEETFGQSTMKKINELNSAELINGAWTLFLGLGANFENILLKATGKNLSEIMSGYHLWLRQQFEEERNAIKKEGLIEGTRLTTHGWQTDQPLWSGDGKKILYRTSTPTRNGLRSMTAEGQQDHEVVPNLGSLQYPSVHPKEDKIVYQRMDYYGPYYFWGDLYEFDLVNKKEERLTHGARAYFSQFSPDGKKLYFSQYIGHDGSTAIAMLDRATKKIETIKAFPNNDLLIYSFEISPDGQELAISAWHRGGYQDIYLMPARGGDLTPITQNKDVDLDPTWSPDGSYLVFSSDKNGVSNLYAYKFSDKTFSKITNTLTGAYDPDISPDGQEIVYSSYTLDGYDIFRIAFKPNDWKSVSFTQEKIPAWEAYPKSDYLIHNYNPIWSLLPKLWLPSYDGAALGLFTLSNDALTQHSYTLALGYDLKHHQPVYALDYTNTVLPLNIDLSVGQSAAEQHQAISLDIPVQMSETRNQSIHIGYRRDQRSLKQEHSLKNSETEKRAWQTFSARYTYFSYSGADLFRDAFNLTLSGSISLIENEEKLERKLSLNWRETFKLPTREPQWLALKLTLGWSDIPTDSTNERAGYYLGGSSGLFLLRGLEPSSLMGQYALVSSLEYRLRLMDINQSLGGWPLFIDDLFARPFVDFGLAGDKIDLSQAKISYGIEARLTIVAGYYNALAWRVGLAQVSGEPKPSFYIDMGTSF
jgi:Tol biopolymer transport system component